jgi:hypothetical protein
MNIKKRWIVLTPLIFLLSFYFGHKILTRIVFADFCEKKTGLFIYEKVELGNSYFLPIEEAKKSKSYDNRLDFNEKYTLDTKKFKSEFEHNFIKSEDFSIVAPVISVSTSFIRKKDLMLLGESVSGIAYVSLFRSLGSNKRETIECPSGRDKNRRPKFYKHHKDLLKNIFSKKQGD